MAKLSIIFRESAGRSNRSTPSCALQDTEARKQAAPDAEVMVNKFEHELRAFAKETTGQVAAATNLKKQYGWIMEQNQ